jgi:lysozyme family protein
VNELEKRLESKEEEIRNLQYKVDDLSGRMGRATIASSSQRSSGEVTTTKREGIIRVDTTAEEIQSALQAAGYYNGPIDGKIGGKTKTAIMEFQKANDLTADGIIGKKTWLALRTYLP